MDPLDEFIETKRQHLSNLRSGAMELLDSLARVEKRLGQAAVIARGDKPKGGKKRIAKSRTTYDERKDALIEVLKAKGAGDGWIRCTYSDFEKALECSAPVISQILTDLDGEGVIEIERVKSGTRKGNWFIFQTANTLEKAEPAEPVLDDRVVTPPPVKRVQQALSVSRNIAISDEILERLVVAAQANKEETTTLGFKFLTEKTGCEQPLVRQCIKYLVDDGEIEITYQDQTQFTFKLIGGEE